ncbi:MAG: pyruvate kinase, partial [Reyranella sp.]
MHRNRFTKIVATLGPASSTPERLRILFEAGADVFRLNFSHGQQEDHRQRVDQLRALEKEYKHPIAILMDLQGPKLRLGTFAKGPMELKKGQKLRFDMDATPGTAKRIPLLHPEIFKAAKPDGLLLIDDGKVRLRIVAHDEKTIDTEVEVAGTISDRKGVNLPNLVLPVSPMTPKDHKDLVFGLSLGVDWVALSFVQHAHDIAELKKLVAGRAAVMAKLEKPQAIEHLDEIIEQSDGIMVARGDLGVEMPPEAVPPLQKRILAACRVAGKPTIVATQMLESMIHSPTPTRAEVSDVATAVYDGTD